MVASLRDCTAKIMTKTLLSGQMTALRLSLCESNTCLSSMWCDMPLCYLSCSSRGYLNAPLSLEEYAVCYTSDGSRAYQPWFRCGHSGTCDIIDFRTYEVRFTFLISCVFRNVLVGSGHVVQGFARSPQTWTKHDKTWETLIISNPWQFFFVSAGNCMSTIANNTFKNCSLLWNV